MRLSRIDGENWFSLVEFTGQDIPPYAILSHTWGPDHGEVTLQDIINHTGREKAGYGKILFCQRQATKDGIQYFWVDTCCIDKSSSAELTESINSMFEWYKLAVVCYVTPNDLEPECTLADELPRCRWFTRGWTLQELLGPNDVRFYDRAWQYIGDKFTISSELTCITGVPAQFLVDGDLNEASVAIKMSWAAKRKTKRPEDWAYCLLGIFDVNMPLIYGEGMQAFRRLQEQIIKSSVDLTIFAWEKPLHLRTPLLSPLATSPARFAESHCIENYKTKFPKFSVTNKGLLLSIDIPLVICHATLADGRRITLYMIHLGVGGET
jgi:hypothetical protein